VISPHVRLLDVDPLLWAEVHRVFARRRHRPAWAYVLHQHGRVVKVAAPTTPVLSVGDRIDSPIEAARSIRSATGVERAVVLDVDHLPALVRDAAAGAEPSLMLPAWRGRVAAAYWSSPGVATDPPPPVDPWPALRAALADGAPHVCALAVLEQDSRPTLAVTVLAVAGVVEEIRGLEVGDASLEAAAAQRLGGLDLVLRCEWSAFETAVATGSPEAYAQLVEQARVHQGLDSLPGLLRSL